mgnify:CR=1 FL=1
MRENSIVILKNKILNNEVDFLTIISEIVDKNKILYSDNYGKLNKEEKEAVSYLENFMHLLYRGSKHSTGLLCESGFSRVVVHNGINLRLTYYSATETFVTVEKLESVEGIKPIVTVELLIKRLKEAEEVKSELAPIIEKYLKAGLTFEEMTRMFVEIMRENRIKL